MVLAGAPGLVAAAAPAPAGFKFGGGGGGGGAAGRFCANEVSAMVVRQSVSSVFISAAELSNQLGLL